MTKETEKPPKPVEPEPGTCCGRGCDPCIYDYYHKALERWHRRIAEIDEIANSN